MLAWHFLLPREASVNKTGNYSICKKFTLQGTDQVFFFPSFPSYYFNPYNYEEVILQLPLKGGNRGWVGVGKSNLWLLYRRIQSSFSRIDLSTQYPLFGSLGSVSFRVLEVRENKQSYFQSTGIFMTIEMHYCCLQRTFPLVCKHSHLDPGGNARVAGKLNRIPAAPASI